MGHGDEMWSDISAKTVLKKKKKKKAFFMVSVTCIAETHYFSVSIDTNVNWANL